MILALKNFFSYPPRGISPRSGPARPPPPTHRVGPKSKDKIYYCNKQQYEGVYVIVDRRPGVKEI